MNNKGNALSIVSWLIATVIIVFFLAGYLYFHHALTNVLTSIPSTSPQVNLSYAVQNTIVPIDSAMNSLTWISYIMIITLAIAILIENYYIRRHPILFIVHVFIVIVSIIASIYVSNEYESLLGSNNILQPTLQQFTVSNAIILGLPLWVAVIGIFGLVLLVINAIRDPEIAGGNGI